MLPQSLQLQQHQKQLLPKQPPRVQLLQQHPVALLLSPHPELLLIGPLFALLQLQLGPLQPPLLQISGVQRKQLLQPLGQLLPELQHYSLLLQLH